MRRLRSSLVTPCRRSPQGGLCCRSVAPCDRGATPARMKGGVRLLDLCLGGCRRRPPFPGDGRSRACVRSRPRRPRLPIPFLWGGESRRPPAAGYGSGDGRFYEGLPPHALIWIKGRLRRRPAGMASPGFPYPSAGTHDPSMAAPGRIRPCPVRFGDDRRAAWRGRQCTGQMGLFRRGAGRVSSDLPAAPAVARLRPALAHEALRPGLRRFSFRPSWRASPTAW